MKSQDLFSREIPRGWLPWGALAPVLALLFSLASELGGDALLQRVARVDAKGLPLDAPGLAVFLLVGFVPWLALVLLWVRLVERRSMASIGWTAPHKLRTYLLGHAIGMLSILGIVLTIFAAGGLTHTTAASAWFSPQALRDVAFLLVCFVVQAGTEEIVFRGWLLSVLAKKFNVIIAVLLSSGLFTLLHLNRGQPLLVTLSSFVFALFCCAWVLRTRNLFGVMGWHAGWNWLLAVGFGLPVTGLDVGIPPLLLRFSPAGPAWLTGGAEGPEGSVVCVVWFITAMFTLSRWKTRDRDAAITRKPGAP